MRLLSILWMTIKQILNNWKLEVSLLVGLAVSVGVVASIPIYTSGALQDAFLRQWVAASDGRPPFNLMVSHWSQNSEAVASLQQYNELNTYLEQNAEKVANQKAISYTAAGGLDTNKFEPTNSAHEPAKYPYADIRFLSDLKETVNIIDGRWYNDTPRTDGIVEAVVDEAGLEALNLLVGDSYVFWYKVPGKIVNGAPYEEELKVLVVGVFRIIQEKADSDLLLYPPPYENSFFVSQQVYLADLVSKRGLSGTWDWYWVFDHNKVHVHELPKLTADLNEMEARIAQIMPETRFWNQPQRRFDYTIQQAKSVSMFLGAFAVPILGMIFYYIILTASLAVSRRRNEIAMMRSRGASFLQILFTFLLEWLLLGGVAYLVGPYIGLGIAKVMGASAGFLTFVGRRALPVEIVPDASRYGAYALSLAVFACLLPVFGASRHSIVTFKQELARSHKQAVWKRFLIDFILIGAAYYGYRSLTQQKLFMTTLTKADQNASVLMDPMLFFVPLVFLLGAGLFVLRIFPYAMAFLSWITNRFPGVCWPLTARHLARNSREYTPLLLLLIITVALGIYSSSAARTLSSNLEDRINYAGGSDVVLKEQWTVPTANEEELDPFSGIVDASEPSEPLIFEPPFYVHQTLPGVLKAARVLTSDVNVKVGGNYKGSGQMMAIVPKEFGEVAWFRSDMAPTHINHYLNVLTKHREGVLVSKQFLDENNLQLGDWIELTMKNQPFDVYVVAAIDLWPSLYPEKGSFFITNLEHVQHYTTLEPYAIWMKMQMGAQLDPVVKALNDQGIWVTSAEDTRLQLMEQKHDPNIMGFFGVLSIGFVVAVVVTIMGFFLFTLWSLRARMLQFGVLRAIGLSVRQLITMLALEEIFTVGVGLAAGTFLGKVASDYFLPFLERSDQFKAAIPKFTIVTDQMDLMKIYIMLGSMLIIGIIVLVVVLFRMRLADAVKLGEEV